MSLAKRFSPLRKLLDAPSLGARQVLAVASDPTLDRTKDVMRPEGCVLDNYHENPVVLANHDPGHPIGSAKAAIRNGRVEALIDFAPAGVSKMADEWCGLAKAGVLRAFSVGFDPIEYKPNKSGGYDYDKWELMELSLVAVPANPSARIIARAFGKTGQVLAERHALAIENAHRRISEARKDLHGVLLAAGRPPADDGEDPEDSDQELSFNAARRKAQRAAELAAIDRVHVGAAVIAKPSAPTRELRGGPHLVKWVREQEEARLRSFWDRR
jgi:HK97 family phage prohead protease